MGWVDISDGFVRPPSASRGIGAGNGRRYPNYPISYIGGALMRLCNTGHDSSPRTVNDPDTGEVSVASLVHHRPPHSPQALPACKERRPVHNLCHSLDRFWSSRHWSWPPDPRCLHILREAHRACPSLTPCSQTRARGPQESSYCSSTSRR